MNGGAAHHRGKVLLDVDHQLAVASAASVRYLLHHPLALLQRLPGDRIAEEETFTAVEVLQSPDRLALREVIDLEGDAGQVLTRVVKASTALPPKW